MKTRLNIGNIFDSLITAGIIALIVQGNSNSQRLARLEAQFESLKPQSVKVASHEIVP